MGGSQWTVKWAVDGVHVPNYSSWYYSSVTSRKNVGMTWSLKGEIHGRIEMNQLNDTPMKSNITIVDAIRL